ncbi:MULTISPECIES: hypothetical protein [Cupriavidus]|uniref:DUF1844 domain-containing protein n=1 Tax=Cupriavidus pauculus TaxID=82633 RepID=A0A3G8HAN0_9BURK|nr:hypothetical protein [Cupriavidus pauculus]AZG16652.1 hypothetical protein EHF44_25085 [Cupriavidus pauculus]
MKRHTHVVTETTADGLAALLYHIAHGASQGQLDPEFVRKLCKRVDKEIEAMEDADKLTAPDRERLQHAVSTLRNTADAEEGALLTRALERLRSVDGQAARSAPA